MDDTLNQVMCEIAGELGCESDNEMILAAIELLKSERNKYLAALRKAEQADYAHVNCEECGGEGEPEECGECFPLADDARLMRWAALGISRPAHTEAAGQS